MTMSCAFIEECCEVGDDYKTSKESLYGAYVEFCESRSTNCLEDNIFWRLLKGEVAGASADYRPRLSRDGNAGLVYVRGIALKPTF